MVAISSKFTYGHEMGFWIIQIHQMSKKICHVMRMSLTLWEGHVLYILPHTLHHTIHTTLSSIHIGWSIYHVWTTLAPSYAWIMVIYMNDMPENWCSLGIFHRHIWHTHDMAYLFTHLMDLDDSKAHLIAIRYLRTDCNHSAASAVPPGTISLRLFPNMVISFICHFGLIHLG